MSCVLMSHIVTSSAGHLFEDNINTFVIDLQQCITQNLKLTCTIQSLINHTSLFMIQFESTKLDATPPAINGLYNKFWGLNPENKC